MIFKLASVDNISMCVQSFAHTYLYTTAHSYIHTYIQQPNKEVNWSCTVWVRTIHKQCNTHCLLSCSWVIEDVGDPSHLSHHGPKTQRIAKRSEPRSDLEMHDMTHTPHILILLVRLLSFNLILLCVEIRLNTYIVLWYFMQVHAFPTHGRKVQG